MFPKFIKNFILWSYSRETSVYVIFCLLIIAFIFLTPKSWFDKSDRLATQTAKIIVKAEEFSTDPQIMQQKARQISGNPDAKIIAWREIRNEQGERIYEIEIR